MSRQRQRHLHRQPTEEAIRLAVSSFVGAAGTVHVQRMSYDWRDDDLLVQVELATPLAGSTLAPFRRELARLMRSNIPAGGPLQDWLVVVQIGAKTIARIRPNDPAEEPTVE